MAVMRFVVLLLLAISTAAEAQSMPVATFLAKADALKAKGAMALFSSDIGVLKREMQNAGLQLRAERQADIKAGRKASSCPPAKAALNSDELISAMRAVPPADRSRTPVKAVLRAHLIHKFPCPA